MATSSRHGESIPSARDKAPRELSHDATVSLPRGGYEPFAAVATFVVVVLLMVGASAAAPFQWLAPALLLPFAAVLALGYAHQPRVVIAERIETNRHGLFVNGVRVAKRRDIVEAEIADTERGQPVVRIHLRRADAITVRPRDRAEGLALVDALALRSRARTFSVTERPSFTHVVVAFVLALAAGAVMIWGPSGVLRVILTLAVGTVALFPAFARSLEVNVGADGLRLVRPLGRARLVAHSDVKRVARESTDVVVELESGETLRWPMAVGHDPKGAALDRGVQAADALVSRILEARAIFEERKADAAPLPLLARGARTPSEWLTSLRCAGDEACGFREGAVGRDRLWSLVESAQTPSAARLEAAIALRVSSDGEAASERFIEIAEQSASPELAKRIRVVADGEEAELEALLGELAEEEQGAPKRLAR